MKLPTFITASLVLSVSVVPIAGAQSSQDGAKALSQVKQLTVGCMIYASDSRQKVGFTDATAKKALHPYLKSDKLWTAPGDSAGTVSFHLNPFVTGKSLDKIIELSRVVLFYEGTGNKPKFKYNGLAVIGFTDGHTKLVTKAEAEKLLWKP